ncbi:hypothetical protein L0U85_16610, partial [Glycomyces sp. L485]
KLRKKYAAPKPTPSPAPQAETEPNTGPEHGPRTGTGPKRDSEQDSARDSARDFGPGGRSRPEDEHAPTPTTPPADAASPAAPVAV